MGRVFFVASKQCPHSSPVCDIVGDVLARRPAVNPVNSQNLWQMAHGRNIIMSLSRRNAASESEETANQPLSQLRWQLPYQGSHCGLPSAACELRLFYSAPLAMTRPVTLAAPFCFKAWAQASKVAPVVKMSSQRSTTLIQSNDNGKFEHPCGPGSWEVLVLI